MSPGNRAIDKFFVALDEASNGLRLREAIERHAPRCSHPRASYVLHEHMDELFAMNEGIMAFERAMGRFPTTREIELSKLAPSTQHYVREIIEAVMRTRLASACPPSKPPEFTGGYRDNPIPLVRPWNPRPGVVAWLWRGVYRVWHFLNDLGRDDDGGPTWKIWRRGRQRAQ